MKKEKVLPPQCSKNSVIFAIFSWGRCCNYLVCRNILRNAYLSLQIMGTSVNGKFKDTTPLKICDEDF
jgi:hypothetical protein